MKASFRAVAVLWGLFAFGPLAVASAYGEDCDGQYFAPEDVSNEVPLKRPHPDFAKKLASARAGGATDQRSLAVAYETGYMVSRCLEKAAYWYDQAAQAGDGIAQAWIKRHQQFARMRETTECAGDACLSAADRALLRRASFRAGPNGHFFAPVTINGVTLEGMVDTGASTIAMSVADAHRFGIDALPGKRGLAGTANGVTVQNYVVLPMVKVAGIELRDVRAAIGITGPILIGMSFLSRLSVQMGQGHMEIAK